MKTKLAVMIALTMIGLGSVQAQKSNEVKVEISKQVDGEKKTFKKTYESEEAMQNDAALKEFLGEDKINLWFGEEENLKVFDLKDMEEHMQNFSFQFGDEPEEGGYSFNFFSDGDSAFSEQFHIQMEELGKHLNIGLATQLQDLQQNMIIDLSKNGSFAYAFSDSTLGDRHQQTFTIRLSKSLAITEDTDEFGKKGRVSNANKLELENLRYYPNPAPNGQFELQFEIMEPGELNISIYNLDGKEIFNRYFEKINENYAETIDLSKQPEGVYLLEIQMNGKRLTRKIAID